VPAESVSSLNFISHVAVPVSIETLLFLGVQKAKSALAGAGYFPEDLAVRGVKHIL